MIVSILLHIVTFLVDKIMVAHEKMHTNNGGGAGRFSFPGQEHVAQDRRSWGCRRENSLPPPEIGKKTPLFQKALDYHMPP